MKEKLSKAALWRRTKWTIGIVWFMSWPVYFSSITMETSIILVGAVLSLGFGIGVYAGTVFTEMALKPKKVDHTVHMTPGYPPERRDYMYPNTYDKQNEKDES